MHGSRSAPSMSFMPRREMLFGRLAMFSLAGVINTLVGVACIVLCTASGMNIFAANVLGYGAGLTIGFLFNSRFTFRKRRRRRSSVTLLRFLISFLLAFGLNLGVIALVRNYTDLGATITSLAGTPIYTIAFFLLCEHWVFDEVKNTP